MLLYESNYLKFHELARDVTGDASHWISRAKSDNDLYLERTLHEPYTTGVCLTYWLRNNEGMEIKDPDMTIRIYHDAAQVEAVSCLAGHRHRRLQELESTHAQELNRRWQINMMLNKWLDYLLDSGHGFA
jgi:uncharacterized protein